MFIHTLDIAGIPSALHAMRNPMDSWNKTDSHFTACPYKDKETSKFIIGEKDKALSIRLQKAGPEHCKHLRMIMVWVNITAPRYWWQEFDTYRAGVEKVSCSTMHKLMAKPLTMEDLEIDDIDSTASKSFINYLNNMMELYKKEDDPNEKQSIWRHIIQNLPQGYLQKRTVMISYAALRNIYRQREGHKLKEWKIFRKWVEKLPESWMITE